MPNKKFSEFDREQMGRAVALAQKAGRTSPNPPVGAVIAKNGRILATGYHRGPGYPHAEAQALIRLKGKASGATLYVTLEPCCHTEKRTPPCVESILTSGISRVVLGTRDPNPKVNGRGLKLLRSRRLKVEEGCLEEECAELILPYEKWITRRLPFVVLKAATTFDGKIATAKGESHWITGFPARKMVHFLRARADAVMVGFNTVMQDNSQLTVRLTKGRNPIRIAVDSHLRLPLNRKIFSNLKKARTWIAVLKSEAKNPKIKVFQKMGIVPIFCRSNRQGRVDLSHLFEELGQRGVTHVMVEGGAAMASALIRDRLADEIWLFVAAKILGGEALDLFSELQVARLKDAPQFEILEVAPVGEDLFLRLRPS